MHTRPLLFRKLSPPPPPPQPTSHRASPTNSPRQTIVLGLTALILLCILLFSVASSYLHRNDQPAPVATAAGAAAGQNGQPVYADPEPVSNLKGVPPAESEEASGSDPEEEVPLQDSEEASGPDPEEGLPMEDPDELVGSLPEEGVPPADSEESWGSDPEDGVPLAGSEESSGSGPPPPSSARVALLFFGLTRSLRFTLPSIEEHLLGPLRGRGFEVDVFVHTYSDTDDDSSVHTDRDEWELLRPTASRITSQEAFLDSTRDKHDACWNAQGTGWEAAPEPHQLRNLKNLLCQLNSLQEVGQLWQEYAAAHSLRHQAVLYVRPDVLYVDPLPADIISHVAEGSVMVPDWSHYGGMNDRFAALAPRSAAAWSERLLFSFKHCLEQPIHAETFAKDFADEKRLNVDMLQDFEFFRVRSDGTFAPGDKTKSRFPAAQEVLTALREEIGGSRGDLEDA